MQGGALLEVPVHDRFTAMTLVQSISNHIPSRLDLPKITEGRGEVRGMFRLGGEEPEISTCWVPGQHLWNDFVEVCADLLEAGYPGCEGCGGDDVNSPWDEEARRVLMSS